MNTTPHPQSEEVEPQVSRYVNYLRNDRGLAKNSVLVYAPFIRGLLVDQVTKTGSVSVDAFDPTSIRSFLLERIHGRSGEYARLLATALRSFFRFLFLRGELPTDLSASVPTVCKPRRTAVPAFLSPEQIDQVIAAIDRSTLTGRRDHAVLLLLARLGLRAGEIILLELDDIHWRTGEIVIRGKGGMVDSLPLLADIGEALALYIRQDRNVNESRRVFLRVYPPHIGLTGPAAIGHIVRQALARAGVRRSGRGAAHLFRHGLATQMIRRGASLTEISEVLRHRSLNTTAIYSQVSFEALRTVARSWPVRTMTETLVQYIALRRALGAKLREPAVRLSEFVTFLKSQGAEFITTELALCWAMQPKNAQRATWARRLSIVRRFALWLNAADPRNQIPPPRLIGGGRRRNPPHIYPDQEVELLMAEASRLPSRRKRRAHTYTTLIGLLATTGLRPGEVLALTRSDVDLQSGILSIRDSKFGKSRFVPIHDSTRIALAGYAGRRDELGLRLRTEAFFVTETNRPLLASAVRRTFAKMSLAVGLRGPGVGRRVRGPRLQDFRHTFATRKLIEWYRAGLDVERELPKLSTYLGHSDVAHTYWYISADPELLQLAMKFLRGRRPGAAK